MSDNDDFKETPRQLWGIDLAHKQVELEKEIASKSAAIRRLQKDLHEDSKRLSHVAESNPGYNSPSKKSSR